MTRENAHWFYRHFSAATRTNTKSPRRNPYLHRPLLERLEDRTLLDGQWTGIATAFNEGRTAALGAVTEIARRGLGIDRLAQLPLIGESLANLYRVADKVTQSFLPSELNTGLTCATARDYFLQQPPPIPGLTLVYLDPNCQPQTTDLLVLRYRPLFNPESRPITSSSTTLFPYFDSSDNNGSIRNSGPSNAGASFQADITFGVENNLGQLRFFVQESTRAQPTLSINGISATISLIANTSQGVINIGSLLNVQLLPSTGATVALGGKLFLNNNDGTLGRLYQPDFSNLPRIVGGAIEGTVTLTAGFRTQLSILPAITWNGSWTATVTTVTPTAGQPWPAPNITVPAGTLTPTISRDDFLRGLAGKFFENVAGFSPLGELGASGGFLKTRLPLINKTLFEALGVDGALGWVINGVGSLPNLSGACNLALGTLQDFMRPLRITLGFADCDALGRSITDIINGRPVDLLKFDTGVQRTGWGAGFSFGLHIPIIPPVLSFSVGASFRAELFFQYQVALGLDTTGFYIHPSTHIGIGGGLSASIYGGLAVFGFNVAKVEGGIGLAATARVGLCDPEPSDGKIYLDEIFRPGQGLAGSFLGALKPGLTIDLTASLKAIIDLWLVSFTVFEKNWRFPIANWERNCSPPPGLGEGGRTLALNTFRAPLPAQLARMEGSTLIVDGTSHDGTALANDSVVLERESGNVKVNWVGLGKQSFPAAGIARVRFIGGQGNDRLEVKSGLGISVDADGGAGDDYLEGGNSTNTLRGGAGNDTLIGGSQRDELYGDGDNDWITGQDGGDLLDGGSGNDTLDGGAGIDALHGGAGNDFLDGDTENDILNGDGDDDTLVGGSGNDVMNGGSGRDLLIGGLGDDQLTAGLGGCPAVDACDTLNGGAGQDILTGGDGHDVLLGEEERDFLYGGLGNDTLDGGAGNDRLEGQRGNDLLYGGTGSDELYGQENNDLLRGGAGDDELYGGEGNDTLHGDQYRDVLDPILAERYNQGRDLLDGEAGDDRLEVSFRAPGSMLRDDLRGGQGRDLLVVVGGDERKNPLEGQPPIPINDTMTLSQEGTGPYVFIARLWDWQNPGLELGTFRFETPADGTTNALEILAIDGLKGNDRLQVDANVTKNVLLIGGDGNDMVQGGAGEDTIWGGKGRDSLSGGSGNDEIHGGEGDCPDITINPQVCDVIDGGAGSDVLYGGDGNDNIRGGGGSGRDVIFAGLGRDFIEAGAGSLGIVAYGGEHDDTIYGSNNVDVIHGDGGADELRGGPGNDVLLGGAGNDTLHGQRGKDILLGGGDHDDLRANDPQSCQPGQCEENSPFVWLPLYQDLSAQEQRAILALATVTGQIDRLRPQITEIRRQIGVVDGLLTRTPPPSAEEHALLLVQRAAIVIEETRLQGQLDALRVQGGQLLAEARAALDLKGHILDEVEYRYFPENPVVNADVLDGGTGNDELYGSVYGDFLIGNAGDDTLFHSAGNDTVVGGGGYDTFAYLGTPQNDVMDMILRPDGPNVRVVVTIGGVEVGRTRPVDVQRYAIYGGAGNDTLRVDFGVNGTYDALLNGGAGNDLLIGMGSGRNYIDGGPGTDTYRIEGTPNDDRMELRTEQNEFRVYQNNFPLPGEPFRLRGLVQPFVSVEGLEVDALGGHDTVSTSAFTSGGPDGGCSVIVRGGPGHDTLIGGQCHDTLYGGQGNDSLLGLGGNDVLDGEQDNDTLDGGGGLDSHFGGPGNDRMRFRADNGEVFDGGDGPDDRLILPYFGGQTITVFARGYLDRPSGNVHFFGATSNFEGYDLETGVAGSSIKYGTPQEDSQGFGFYRGRLFRDGRPLITQTEFAIPTPSTIAIDIAAGSDGNLWYTRYDTHKIGRIMPTGEVAEFPIPTQSGEPLAAPTNITLGPDKNMWFSELNRNKIGWITPLGVITEIPVPAGVIGLSAPTFDLNGNLWFAGQHSHHIVRRTTAGVFTVFLLPVELRNPFEIAVGSDGNLWFTASGSNRIGRIAPNATSERDIWKSEPLGTPNSRPYGITAGPDGSLWFTENGRNSIGSISLAGTIRETLPGSAIEPLAITTGPDGQLWFTEFGGDRIRKISTDGVITDVLPSVTRPRGITLGPDGNVWYTQQSPAGKIGRITPGSPEHFVGRSYGVGNEPLGVVTADFDGRNGPDMAVVSRLSADMHVRLNNGDGIFGDPVGYATQNGPRHIAVGRLHGDDFPDLIVTNSDSNTVSVFLGLGNGQFRAGVPYATGSHPEGLVLGDFTGDGRLDIAVGIIDRGTVEVLPGMANGTFGPRSSTPVGPTPEHLAAGDFNRDGNLDLVVAHALLGGQNLTVLLNNGSGTFSRTAMSLNPGVTHLSGVTTGDFTNDGILDLAVISDYEDPIRGLLHIVSGNGNGTFQNINTPGLGRQPSSVTALDYDRDGCLDVVTAHRGDNSLSLLRGNCGGGMVRVSIPVDSGPRGIATADFNRDGWTDLAVTAQNGRSVRVLLNNPVVLVPLPAVTFRVVPSTTTSIIGATFPITVTALDFFGNPATGYRGTVSFTSSSAAATLPPNYRFLPIDNGVKTFDVALRDYGPRTVTVGDVGNSSLQGTSPAVLVTPPPSSFRVGASAGSITAGDAVTLTVTAFDFAGLLVAGYRGLACFSSTDAQATLPPCYRFTTADNGTKSFSNVILRQAGSRVINVADTGPPSLGGSAALTVAPAAASIFVASFTSPIIAGVAGTFTVTARDPYGNVATGYRGTVRFSGSDPRGTLPADYPFIAIDQGVKTFPVTFRTAGSQTLAFADLTNPELRGQVGDTVVRTLERTIPGACDCANTIVNGSDGNRWFLAPARAPAVNQLGRVTPAGDITMFVVPFGADSLVGLATGPDGNLWFTETTTRKVVRINPRAGSDAQIRAQILDIQNNWFGPTQGTPWRITAGPDGNLWFTELSGNRLGRITPQGAITEFLLDPAVFSGPFAITAGPDGNLWFTTDSASAVVGRISPLGTNEQILQSLRRFPLPAGSNRNYAILSGPDGNLWYTSRTANVIGRISPAGILLGETRLRDTGDPFYLTAGPDGNVWFAAGGGIGRLTAAGVLTEFPLPAPGDGAPSGITTDRDGNLWVVLQTANQIVRFSPRVTVAPAAASIFVASFTSPIMAGVAGTFTVTARDPYGNVATGYRGTVRFTSTDPRATLPTDYPFIAGDQGMKTFPVTLRTAGSQTLAMADLTNPALRGQVGDTVVRTLERTIPEANAGANSIVVGSDGNFWFLASTVNKLGRVTPAGDITMFAVPFAADSLVGLATGPDGNLWFTERTNRRIVRINPRAGSDAQIRAQILDSRNWFGPTQGTPWRITAGPDGNLWFTELFGNRLGRITPQGAITEFLLDSAMFSGPYAITAGPDGNLWFTTDSASAVVGRISPIGTNEQILQSLRRFPLPAGSNRNYAILSGPDGNLWYTSRAANTIGRISPAGILLGEVTLRQTGDPFYLTAGPDGNVWYAAGGGIGRLTAAGVLTEFALPAPGDGAPSGITTDRDGNLWVVLQTANQIVRFSPRVTVNPAAADRLTVTGFPTTITAGEQRSFTVTAFDPFNNIDTNYVRTIRLSSDDTEAIFPISQYTFLSGDRGTKTFNATLRTAHTRVPGTRTIIAEDILTGTIRGQQTGILVNPNLMRRFQVTPLADPVTAGQVFSVLVTAVDDYGNRTPGYVGRPVTFTSSDPYPAVLPPNYTFTTADAGEHVFDGVQLFTTPSQTITVTDTQDASRTGTTTMTVDHDVAAFFYLQVDPSPVLVGQDFTLTLIVFDAYGNVAVNYAGLVSLYLTEPDPGTTLPERIEFTGAEGGFAVITAQMSQQGDYLLEAYDESFTVYGATTFTVMPAEEPGPGSQPGGHAPPDGTLVQPSERKAASAERANAELPAWTAPPAESHRIEEGFSLPLRIKRPGSPASWAMLVDRLFETMAESERQVPAFPVV